MQHKKNKANMSTGHKSNNYRQPPLCMA